MSAEAVRMRGMLEALLAELRTMKREGEEAVAVETTSLLALSQAVARWRVGETPPPATPAAQQERVPPVAPRAVPAKAPTPPPAAATLPPPQPFVLPEGSKQERWEWLRRRVLECPVCRAQVRRGKQIVFGSGHLDARLFFCGEAPGAEEEERGEVFVGPAGQLLTKIIEAMGLRREEVYIGNIMNWRPQVAVGNRPPTSEEISFCLPYLKAQMDIVQPRVVVALGNTAMKGLLGNNDLKLGAMRGRWQTYEGRDLMITYHPSYLLHNDTLAAKRSVWEDLLLVMERLGLPISEKQRGYFLRK